MELPPYFKTVTEAMAAGRTVAELCRLSERLTQGYTDPERAGKRIVTSKDGALVYSIVRMPATYAAVHTALLAALSASPRTIRSVLDVGSGTGAASFAALALADTVETLHCVEREPAMLEAAEAFFAASPFRAVQVDTEQTDLAAFRANRQYDLVLASYAFGEFPKAQREAILTRLWEATGSLLLVVEPGTPESARLQSELRACLLARGATLAAPCRGNCCPLPQDDWCAFSCRVSRTPLHRAIKGDSPFEDEKFTYTAAVRGGSAPAPCGRVLRHPVMRTNAVTVRFCLQGELYEKTYTKRDGARYKQARKYHCGDPVFPAPPEFS